MRLPSKNSLLSKIVKAAGKSGAKKGGRKK